MSDVTGLTIAALVDGYRDGTLSPVDVTQAYLARIEQENSKVNAFVLVDRDGVTAAAAESEKAYSNGTESRPLAGVPLAHKDLYCSKGLRSTAGSRVLENHVPDEDATSIARLKDAGALNLGKLNTHEFAYGPTNEHSMFGACRNPWDTQRFSGGSSGGSGAAVALDLCAGATGSDTGGSIRMPAACCGITGLKPTYGRVSRAGIFPLCWTMDHSGPMTHTAEDAAIMLQAMAGVDDRDAATADRSVPDYRAALTGDIKGKRIGVPTRYFFDQAQPDIDSATRDALNVLEGLGADIVEVDIEHIEHAAAAALAIYLGEGTAYHDHGFEENQSLYTDSVRSFLELGNFLLAKDYLHAQRFRTLLGHSMADVLETVDFLVTPGTPLVAQAIGQEMIAIRNVEQTVFASILRNTEPFDLTGIPALVVPSGFSKDGMPFSLQIAGRPFDEAGILNVGHAYQQATDWHTRRPAP
jgi:aspartyl-tRNA(Asn)/glutamyl-tRNA(Gln) amidotransferase subunit A